MSEIKGYKLHINEQWVLTGRDVDGKIYFCAPIYDVKYADYQAVQFNPQNNPSDCLRLNIYGQYAYIPLESKDKVLEFVKFIYDTMDKYAQEMMREKTDNEKRQSVMAQTQMELRDHIRRHE